MRIILKASRNGVSGMIFAKYCIAVGIALLGQVNPPIMNAGEAIIIRNCVAFKAFGKRTLKSAPKNVQVMMKTVARIANPKMFSQTGILIYQPIAESIRIFSTEIIQIGRHFMMSITKAEVPL